MFRTLVISLFLSFGSISSIAAHAQEAAEDETKRLDTVTVVGSLHPIYGSAMSKFEAGDYIGADEEFRRIAMRIQSDRFSMESSIANVAIANRTPQRLAPGVQGGGTMRNSPPLDQATNFHDRSQSDSRDSHIYHLGDDDYGFSLYMAGLSQIQLGEFDKAKASFSRAVVYNKTLDDAHFRIGLLELFDGRVNKAETKLRKLETLVQRCTPDCIDAAGNDLAENLATLQLGIEQFHSGELSF